MDEPERSRDRPPPRAREAADPAHEAADRRSDERAARGLALPAPDVRLAPDFRARCDRLVRRVRRAAGTRLGAGARGAVAPAAGFDFVGYRAYRPGDDPRAVDWALVARSGRLAVRLTRAEAETRWRIVVDTSASMGLGHEPPPRAGEQRGPSCGKLTRAAELALSWVRLGVAAGAQVELTTTGEDAFAQPAWLRGSAGFERAVHTAAGWRAAPPSFGGPPGERAPRAQGAPGAPGAQGGLGAWVRTRAARPGRDERLVLIGDLADLEPSELARLRAPRRAVTVLQVLAPSEVAPEPGLATWIDPESGESVVAGEEAGASGALAAYRRALAEWRDTWRRAARAARVDFASHSSDVPFEAWF